MEQQEEVKEAKLKDYLAVTGLKVMASAAQEMDQTIEEMLDVEVLLKRQQAQKIIKEKCRKNIIPMRDYHISLDHFQEMLVKSALKKGSEPLVDIVDETVDLDIRGKPVVPRTKDLISLMAIAKRWVTICIPLSQRIPERYYLDNRGDMIAVIRQPACIRKGEEGEVTKVLEALSRRMTER